MFTLSAGIHGMLVGPEGVTIFPCSVGIRSWRAKSAETREKRTAT